jgi:hypothetical protein
MAICGSVKFNNHNDRFDGGFAKLWESINAIKVLAYQRIQWFCSQG